MLRTIVVSDLHIGMPESQSENFLLFLENTPCKTLIINGDLIDELYMKYFSKWKASYTSTIKQLKSICKKNKTNIVYIQGNHELSLDKIPELKDIKIQNDMIYLSHGRKYYICHGHQFDRANDNLGVMSYLAFFSGNILWAINRVYNVIRKRLGLKQQSLMVPIKHFAKNLIGGQKNIDKKIYNKAREKNCDGIICGHFHEPENRKIGNIQYLNSGDWMETGSAIVETQRGNWEVIIYNK